MYVATVQEVNDRFKAASFGDSPPVLDPGGTLADALEKLGIDIPGDLASYLRKIPTGIAAALISTANAALRDGIPLIMTWLAGYGFELTVAQADRDGGSLISVVLRGPSPSDLALSE